MNVCQCFFILQVEEYHILDSRLDKIHPCRSYFQRLRIIQQILDNKNSELGMKEDTIKQQKKELRKQKFLKFLGLGGSVILPIIAILLLV